ncbi:hypothetical protein, partial [Streptomyces sp. NPDC059828]|uniref:hypothetical protein n=1 Tax=Streptomyces sp. NPDC059828 TaxID=3346965 RepID=UPI00365B272C
TPVHHTCGAPAPRPRPGRPPSGAGPVSSAPPPALLCGLAVCGRHAAVGLGSTVYRTLPHRD